MKTPPTLEISLDGVTDLPPGKLANVVTYMERAGIARSTPSPLPDSLELQTRHPASVPAYRALYRRIGQDLLWVSRTLMSDAALAEWLNTPTTVIRFLLRAGLPIGLVELDRAEPEETEIVSFGLVPEEVGKGIGHRLMERVLADETEAGAARVWLHTCTFDHPAAVAFYTRHGFRAFKLAVEVFDDPRLSGRLPRSAAPGIPLIEPIAGDET